MPPPILSPIQVIRNKLLDEKKITLKVKREDLIKGGISGNKFRKLKYNIQNLIAEGSSGIVTFGGAFSNHIHAVAIAGSKYNLNTLGFIRGEIDPHNPTLISAQHHGMQLIPISRSSYRLKEHSSEFGEIMKSFPNYTLIPEGGTNDLALKGVGELVDEIEHISEYDFIAVSAGTGGTAAGIYKCLPSLNKLMVFSALKGNFLKDEILKITGKTDEHLFFYDQYSFGGYAKTNHELIQFINDFYHEFKIPLDPIYNGKLVFGLFDLIHKDFFESGMRILWIHTGGLQGIDGYNYMNKSKMQIIMD